MSRTPLQKAKRLRLEAAVEAQKAEWLKKKAQAASKSGAAKKMALAEAYEEESKYRKLKRRLKPVKKADNGLDALVKGLLG